MCAGAQTAVLMMWQHMPMAGCCLCLCLFCRYGSYRSVHHRVHHTLGFFQRAFKLGTTYVPVRANMCCVSNHIAVSPHQHVACSLCCGAGISHWMCGYRQPQW